MQRKFLKQTIYFLIPILLVFLSGLLLPPTPRASKSLLFANIKKDSLLANTEKPRIIFVGGSNLSFGLNSPAIKDSLGLNPINTGVNAAVGIKYMLENTLRHIKKGDKIVLALEYELLFEPYHSTSDILLRTILDVFPEKADMLSLEQKLNLIQYLPRYSLTKLKPTEYVAFTEDDTYGGNSFNKFGDAYTHWYLNGWDYTPIKIEGVINETVIIKIKEFERSVQKKEGEMYVTFPGIDEVTFKKSKDAILRIEETLMNHNFKILGNAKRYVIPKEMMFDTHYHLLKNGVDYRTKLFIQDYRREVAD